MDFSRPATSRSFWANRCSKSRRVDSMSGAANDSVSLISFLHFGQMMVGSAISIPLDSVFAPIKYRITHLVERFWTATRDGCLLANDITRAARATLPAGAAE